MPIEFNCTHCSNRLRVPDESAGRKARCPKCQQVVEIPASGGPPAAAPGSPSPQSPPPPDNPFAGPAPAKPYADRLAAGESVNPYASPSGQFSSGAGATFPHRQIEFSKVLEESWSMFSDNMGIFALATLIMMAISFAVAFPLALVQQAIIRALAPELGDPVAGMALGAGVGFVTGFINTLVYAYFYGGMVFMAAKAARGRRPEVGDLFATGPYYLRVLGAQVIIYLLTNAVQLLVIAPFFLFREPIVIFISLPVAIILFFFIFLTFLLTPFFIIDCDMGVIDALKASAQYMNGSRLTALGLSFVAGLLGMLVILLTCGIGTLVVTPFFFMLWAVIYLHATGQQTAVEFRKRQSFGGGFQPPR